jgi:hypothetical protein
VGAPFRPDETNLFIDSGHINNDADRPLVDAPGATVQLGGNPDDGFFGPALIANGFTNQGRFVFVRDTPRYDAMDVPLVAN